MITIAFITSYLLPSLLTMYYVMLGILLSRIPPLSLQSVRAVSVTLLLWTP